MTGASPLIVTLALDPQAQDRFDALRQQHFPAERNQLAAHVTLFHQLPGEELKTVRSELRKASNRGLFAVGVSGVRFLGRGVAYSLSSPQLTELRAALAAAWLPWLTPQDRQPFQPHVTVQNKVAPDRARELHSRLVESFAPETVDAVGLDLWRYLGGPWQHVERYSFGVSDT